MRTRNIFILFTMLALHLSACTDIEDGTTDIDSWPAINEYTLAHPCMLHTAADLSYVASKLTVAPWSEGYDKLKRFLCGICSYAAGGIGTYGPGELGQQVSGMVE